LPPNGYAAKFSTPDCIAAGFLLGEAGLAAFEDAAIGEPGRRALAAKISFVIDPDNPYPRNYTGHLKAALVDGRVIEIRQPHMRGGAHEPLSDAELIAKYRANCAFGGFDPQRAETLLAALDALASGRQLDLTEARA
jgi:2-methylcitrate dehydratase PrpD